MAGLDCSCKPHGHTACFPISQSGTTKDAGGYPSSDNERSNLGKPIAAEAVAHMFMARALGPSSSIIRTYSLSDI